MTYDDNNDDIKSCKSCKLKIPHQTSKEKIYNIININEYDDMINKNTNKVAKTYHCKLCDLETRNKTNFNKHLSSYKHYKKTSLNITYNELSNPYMIQTIKSKNEIQEFNASVPSATLLRIQNKKNIINVTKKFKCTKCNKIYNSRQSLWRHNKKGDHYNETHSSSSEFNASEVSSSPLRLRNTDVDKEMFYTLIQQNQEFKNMIIEQNNQIMELKQTIPNVINNNINSNNKQFNLNFFLNEQCKNAINITDFINSLQIEIEDVENVGKNGYVNGITHIIMKHLNKLDIYTRPIHCTDLKREVLHIRDENKWNKETNKEKIKKCVEKIANKNCRKIAAWQESNPESAILDSNSYNLWLEIIKESMFVGEKEQRKNDQVIKNIVKFIVLNKE